MDHLPADTQPIDFDDMANQMLAEGAEQSPAYVHGGICGVYAGAGAIDPEECLAATSQALELGLHGELADTSLRLAEVTLHAMQDEEFEFHLLLPDDDDTEMASRVRTLGEWCRGFLAAYALMVADTGSAGLGDETGEILKDVAAIADASFEEDDDEDGDPEDAENYFFELTEYLRFASLNLFMDRLIAVDAAAGEQEE
jgi:uncharacterized protein YgfB (UPF0149 family)